jgi:hypothetical protein
VLTIEDVKRRVERLEQLSMGLAEEVYLFRQAEDPLLYLERRKYLCALQDALFGVEAARVVLAQVVQRTGREQKDKAA